ncbi:hypothetical protein AVEN_258536-1 [Araneus ventricosus]|uniref:Uncharacterized protein n=1 Tax=Araneus ventricosus TaxID=182803 RepID=A0A4Y2RNC9_ARAVE|nr:hypothetical protein AVEN_27303-1 [Araneus ventricosus]GBN14691.1 hypothetical protein AVEN_244270-1 [Araneus ventricosus]GBN77322.1 hypothetical protein AVEN_226423-1 [Araneus ventricosus]GBN77330.1 hypothetical protein AVEN_258536-1 [Araneus ventricosus]
MHDVIDFNLEHPAVTLPFSLKAATVSSIRAITFANVTKWKLPQLLYANKRLRTLPQAKSDTQQMTNLQTKKTYLPRTQDIAKHHSEAEWHFHTPRNIIVSFCPLTIFLAA